jgi:hypothetical protein
MQNNLPVMETLYTPQELATMFKMSDESMRRIFMDEPGVLKHGSENRKGKKRAQYVTLRIPASVAERVYRRMIR